MGNEIKLVTNRVPRDIITGYDLTESEKKEFDYLKEDEMKESSFFRYRGQVYYLGNFMRYNHEHSGILWHGSEGHSYFNATLVHLCQNGEQVIVASARW